MDEEEITENVDTETVSTTIIDEAKSIPEVAPEVIQKVIPLEFPPRKIFETALLPGFPLRLRIPHHCLERPSLQDRVLSHITTTDKPLFTTVLNENEKEEPPSILVTGFGLRNLASLQEALQLDERNKLKQLYLAQERKGEDYSTPSSCLSNVVESESGKSISSGTQTNLETDSFKTKKKLMYLMGLDEDEEEGTYEELETKVKEPITLTSESMRNAQRYLRSHNIYKFFEFIIAHMLSALPDNPIEFIIDLLNKCLVFRAGFSEPPLLYNRKHLESLFYLMDRMRTGYIDVNQYKTGMHTLGICSFNESPPLSDEGMVTKDYFIEEAYNELTDQLTDLLRRRWISGVVPPEIPPPPPTPQISMAHIESYEDLECSTLKF